MRGEKGSGGTAVKGLQGSPPLARGKGIYLKLTRALQRITPACAGKSCFCGGAAFRCKDHPRLRGEKLSPFASPRKELGSPPLARGKEVVPSAGSGDPGITPACAGKSSYFFSGFAFTKDHPRLRGEKNLHLYFPQRRWGSPPLARGKEGGEYIMSKSVRITPACAGKRLME